MATMSSKPINSQTMTLEEKITAAATILAENKPKASLERPHYTVCTTLLREHPLNGVAPLLSWKPGEGAYAITYARRGQKAHVFIAGEDGVPDAKVKFLEELWSKIFIVRNMKSPRKRQRTEGNTLDKQISQEVFDVWELVVFSTYQKLFRRIRKHLPYIQLFRKFITPEHIKCGYARAFLLKFIDMFEILDQYLTRVEEIDGPSTAASAFANHKNLLAMFMILTAQFHNQMGYIWKLIDDIAVVNRVACDEFGKRAHRDYSRHFVKTCLIFLQTYELIESTRAPIRGCLWDTPIQAHVIDQRDAIPQQPADSASFQRQIQHIATEIFDSAEGGDKLRVAIDLDIAPPKKAVPPELQIVHIFKDLCPQAIYRLVSSSRSTPYITEAVLSQRVGNEYQWRVTKGVGRVYKTWSLPNDLLPEARLEKIYNILCYEIIALAQEKLETDDDGTTRAEKEEEERLRLRELRLGKYRREMSYHMERMLRSVHGLPSEN
ncbi:hypothetical protein KEM54_003860 [Ascosphaera aggregata]|nr:hypothetical protein KEM54_003860 [Ascosphaera aggregata]